MSQDTFLDYLRENTDKLSELSKERIRVVAIFNKIDEMLEGMLKRYREVVCEGEQSLQHHPGEIDTLNSHIELIMSSLQRILSLKANQHRFRSVDRILELIPICTSFSVLSKGLDNIFAILVHEKFAKDFAYFEQDLPRFCLNLENLYKHRNLTQFFSLSWLDVFIDDPKFHLLREKSNERTDEPHEREEKLKEYNDDLIMELPAEAKPDLMQTENREGLDNKKHFTLHVKDLAQKYPHDTHYQICQKVIKQEGLKVEEGSPLFDKILFKARVCKHFSQFKHRVQVVSSSIEALRLIGRHRHIIVAQFYCSVHEQAIPERSSPQEVFKIHSSSAKH